MRWLLPLLIMPPCLIRQCANISDNTRSTALEDKQQAQTERKTYGQDTENIKADMTDGRNHSGISNRIIESARALFLL